MRFAGIVTAPQVEKCRSILFSKDVKMADDIDIIPSQEVIKGGPAIEGKLEGVGKFFGKDVENLVQGFGG